MTTHIFLAMGMWPETVRQNIVASGDTARWVPGHYTAWMTYALLQQGKTATAEAVMARTRANMTPRQTGALLAMRAYYLINSEHWTDSVAAWPLDQTQAGPVQRAMDLYVAGTGAIVRKLPAGTAAAALRQLDSLASGQRLVKAPGLPSAVPGILAKQLAARIEWAAGRREAAVALVRTAIGIGDTLAVEFGPPDVVKPSHELLGEMLLELKRPAEAQVAFQRSLELAPGRSLSLLGLSRAARAAGDLAVADRALATLAANWSGADPDTRGLGELKQQRASAR
jgi:hypothetical protein